MLLGQRRLARTASTKEDGLYCHLGQCTPRSVSKMLVHGLLLVLLILHENTEQQKRRIRSDVVLPSPTTPRPSSFHAFVL